MLIEFDEEILIPLTLSKKVFLESFLAIRRSTTTLTKTAHLTETGMTTGQRRTPKLAMCASVLAAVLNVVEILLLHTVVELGDVGNLLIMHLPVVAVDVSQSMKSGLRPTMA